MGRPPIEIDPDVVIDLLSKGFTQKDISTELGVSIPTLSKRIADIQSKQGVIVQYRAVQSLQLTELQCRILEAITPEKIAEASLKDLILAFKILKDKELTIEGKPTEIKGLLGYLIKLEQEDAALARPTPDQVVDIKATSEKVRGRSESSDSDSDSDDIGDWTIDDDPDYIPNIG